MATSPVDVLVNKKLKAGDKIRIGRNVTCELVIKSPFVSGVHCSVEARTSSGDDSNHALQYIVQDLSSNGTWVLRGAVGACNKTTLTRMNLKMAKKLEKRSDERLLPVSDDDHHSDCVLKQLSCSPSDNTVTSHDTSFDMINTRPLSCRNSTSQLGVKRKSLVTSVLDTSKKAKIDCSNSSEVTSTRSDKGTGEGVSTKCHMKDREEEMERCPSCWKLFPKAALPIHCPICQDSEENKTKSSDHDVRAASPKPTKDSGTKPRSERDSAPKSIEFITEQCPKCLEIFPLVELVGHAEKCSVKMEISTVGRGACSLSKGVSLEQCPHCLEMFSITELISHSETCHRRKSSSGECISLLDDEDIETDSVSKRYTLEAFDRSAASKSSTTSSTLAAAVVVKPCEAASSLSEVKSKGASIAVIDVEQCTHCLKDFPITELVSHSAVCSKRNTSEGTTVLEHCEHCLNLFPLSELVGHSLNCSQRKDLGSLELEMTDGVVGGEEVWGEPVERCMHCFKDFPLSKIVLHSRKCTGDMLGPKERFKNFLPSIHDLDAVSLSVLTDTQMAAVEYVMTKSKEDSERVQHLLKEKVLALGYTERDLEKTLQWIRQDAPIIIHVNLDRALHFLVKDTHYRNLFETGTGSGCLDKRARSSWEDRIFNRLYTRSAPADRVKYGVLNIVGDPHGVRSCYGYGDSFLQLKKVRLRTTFASADTSASTVKLSCCEHYGNVLHEYNNSELKAILDVATRKKEFLRSDMISNYKEVQIHGPVCLSENVDCIVVNERHGADTAMRALLDEFVEKNKCNLIWMEPEASISYPSFSPVTSTMPFLPLATHTTLSSVAAHLTAPVPPPRASRRRRRRRRRRDWDYD